MTDKKEPEDKSILIENYEEELLMLFKVLYRDGEVIMHASAGQLETGNLLHDLPFVKCADETDGYQQFIAILIRQNMSLREKISTIKSAVKDL